MSRRAVIRIAVAGTWALWLAACSPSRDEPTASAAGGTATAQPPSQATAAACNNETLIGCDFPPLQDLTTGACDYLRQHLAGRQVGDETIERVVSCDPPVVSAAADLRQVAAVAARLEVDGPPSHGAFLFARIADGWRLTDQLLDPSWTHGGSCEVRFRLKWDDKEGQFAKTIETLSERVCHMPLDQRELAAGESDVASRECQQARYGLAGDRLTRLSRAGSDEACQFE